MTHSIPAEHAQHDLDLIAGHAAGDLTDTQRIRADELLQSCTSCADLRRDLVAIASATRTLPALSANRDFRLSSAQAARLRRRGWIESLRRPFAAPRSTVRPMAMAFTSLGLAGLLLTNILPSLLGGAPASAPVPAAIQPAASAASAPDQAGGYYGQGQPAATTGNEAQFGPVSQATASPIRGGANDKSTESSTPAGEVAAGGSQGPSGGNDLYRLNAGREDDTVGRAAPQQSPIVTGSLVLLLVGLALFGLRFLARRSA